MSKTVTLRLKDHIYDIFKKLADGENRTISNFIETSVLRNVENSSVIDEFEMAEIQQNESLKTSIEQGLKDANMKKGHLVK